MTAAPATELAPAPFSARIRTESRGRHEEAETSPFAAALLDGALTREAYADLLGQLYFVYEALEEAAELQRTDPIGAPFVDDRLTRGAALRTDLGYWFGDGWESAITPTEQTCTYVRRIHDVASNWAGGFVAHHYTRYLGDLSGGQAIRRVLTQEYGVGREADAEGIAFYRFDAITKPKLFKDAYRERLDAAPWSAHEQERIIDEVNVAFTMNTLLFSGLDHHVAAGRS